MKLGIIIFSRLSSTRFKGKALKKINKCYILEIIYRRLLKATKKIPIIIATTNNVSDNKIANFCEKRKIKLFRGSNKNVLLRAKECCEKFNLDSFVRICADRPFLDYNLLKRMIKKFLLGKYDIVTNVFPKTYSYGLTCEIIKVSALNKIDKKKIKRGDTEHIFNYFYRNNKKFKIKNFYIKNQKNKNLKLSLDTKKDFYLFKKIYKKNNYNFLLNTNTAIKDFKRIK